MIILKLIQIIRDTLIPNQKPQYTKLKEHQFFSLMAYWINMEIDNLPISHELKKKVVSKFLKIKFNVFQKNFLCYINSMDTSDSEALDLEKIFINSISEYEEEAIRKFIHPIFVSKFHQWNTSHTQVAFEAIKSITESTFYPTPYEKMAATLDILVFAFRLTIVDAEKTINGLNGELEQILKGTVFDN